MLAICIVLAGCDFSSQNQQQSADNYANLVSLQKPSDNSQSSKTYIDSVQTVEINNKQALLIKGTFPDACTKLGEASHHQKDGNLYLDITAWRKPDSMCAQVLTPFSFIYEEFPSSVFSTHEEIIINGKAYDY